MEESNVERKLSNGGAENFSEMNLFPPWRYLVIPLMRFFQGLSLKQLSTIEILKNWNRKLVEKDDELVEKDAGNFTVNKSFIFILRSWNYLILEQIYASLKYPIHSKYI